jgi:hypothetical protein
MNQNQQQKEPLDLVLDELLETARSHPEPEPEPPSTPPRSLAAAIFADLHSKDREIRLARWRQIFIVLGFISLGITLLIYFFSLGEPTVLPVPELNLPELGS